MKRFKVALFALFGLCALSSCALAVETEVSAVWGVPFGASFEEAHKTLTEDNGLQMLFDVTALEGRRQSLYGGSFFGRSCLVQVDFGEDGMWSFRFLFNRVEPSSQEDQAQTVQEREAQFRQEIMGGNYVQFSRMLINKYGLSDRDFTLPDGEGKQWLFGKRSIVLTADGRSQSGHTTVLTYLDRAIAPKD